MSQRVVVILLIALVVAGGVSLLVYRMVVRQARQNAQASSQVVVAARDLEVGTLIKETDLKIGNWPGAVPKGVLVKKDVAIGRGVVFPVYDGEPLNESRLATPGAGGGLAATIPQGMRACAVRVNEVVGVAGFVSPGQRVDVLVSGNAPGSSNNNGPKVRTILQNIEVLSAGQNIQKDAEGKPVQVPVVNLLVTPEQAEILSLASNETRIQLVLRNPLDTQLAKPPGKEMANLFSPEKPERPAAAPVAPRPRVVAPPPPPKPVAIPPAPAPIPTHRVEVLNGDQKTEAQYQLKTEAHQ